MKCKLCGEHIAPECLLYSLEICVFCFYDTDEWESNGQLITRDQAIIRPAGKRKPKQRMGVPATIRPLLQYISNCVVLAIARDAPTTTIDIDLLVKFVEKLGFEVYRSDMRGVTGPEDAAVRLSAALGRRETNIDIVMQAFTNLQNRKQICCIIENFEDAVTLEWRKSKPIEGTMREYAQRHRDAAWLFFGTRDMLPAFVGHGRPFYRLGIVFIEEQMVKC